MDIPHQTWIETQSGVRFELSDPDPDSVALCDITHALGKLCRYTGHTSRFYSVAEHSIHVASLVPEELRLAALLHDAAEAYIGDLSTPLKMLISETGPLLKVTENKILSAVWKKFGISLTAENLIVIHEADIRVLLAERRFFLGRLDWGWGEEIRPAAIKFMRLDPDLAADTFRQEIESAILRRYDAVRETTK